VDILVGTPQRLAQHAERGNLFYGDVRWLVLDEADTMFDRGFGPEVRALLGPLRSKQHAAACVFVAATVGKVGPARRQSLRSRCSWLPAAPLSIPVVECRSSVLEGASALLQLWPQWLQRALCADG
jgi:DEAD/DEAH box helicase